jgi:DNA-binding response OmpR family regulator
MLVPCKVSDTPLWTFSRELRKKLEWTSTSGFEIRSVRGVGYRMDLHGPRPT